MKPITVTITVSSPEQAKMLERLAARLGEIEDATMQAADGAAIEVCESATLEAVLELGRGVVSDALRTRIEGFEKKGRRPGSVAAKTGKATAKSSGGS
jgi:hypothetical protein